MILVLAGAGAALVGTGLALYDLGMRYRAWAVMALGVLVLLLACVA